MSSVEPRRQSVRQSRLSDLKVLYSSVSLSDRDSADAARIGRARETLEASADEGCRLWLCLNYVRGTWLSESVDDALLGDTEDIAARVVEGSTDRPAAVPEKTWAKLLNLWGTVRWLGLDTLSGHPRVVVDVTLVLGVHARVMFGLMEAPGSFRTCDVGAAKTGVTYAPHGEVASRTECLLAFVSEELAKGGSVGDAFRIATLFFSEFLKIHPHSSGNGRVARLIVNVILAPSVVVPFVIRAAIPQSNARYLRALRESQQLGNFGPLVQLMVESSAETSRAAAWLMS